MVVPDEDDAHGGDFRPGYGAVLVERDRLVGGSEYQPAGSVEVNRELPGPVILERVRASSQEIPDPSSGSKIS
jgi:hypothetical protein